TVSWSPGEASTLGVGAAIYADANGDGIVDERDVIAIGVNWGNTHTNTSASVTINLSDTTLLNHHRDAFQEIYSSLSGQSEAVKTMRVLLKTILGIQVPGVFALRQNYPNPFNPETIINFELPEEEIVTLTIYNLLGQVVTVPIDKKHFDAGIHSVHLDGGKFSSGVYLYRIKAGSWSAVRKLLVIK
ncbi:MAG: T9SS type A sorting domain-containing protein, partial [Candidatus Marinimicrobia bacterium]|nr:T9SS type A sorting domain-containing protein [Candidatus Neomarinimicrobiota bacterium]